MTTDDRQGYEKWVARDEITWTRETLPKNYIEIDTHIKISR